jgi:hypothetical protein
MKLFYKILIVSIFISVDLFSQQRILKKEVQTTFTQKEKNNLVPEGSEVSKTYREDGKIKEESNKRFWAESGKTIDYITKYFYGNAGSIDSSVLFDGEKKVLKLVYIYDSTKLNIGAVEILPSGETSFKTNYEYNKDKQKVSEILFDPKGQIFNEKTFKYNDKNLLTEETGIEKGSLRYKWIYKYDKRSFLVERKDYDRSGKLIRLHTYFNNRDGRPVKETETSYDQQGTIIRVINYSYEYY